MIITVLFCSRITRGWPLSFPRSLRDWTTSRQTQSVRRSRVGWSTSTSTVRSVGAMDWGQVRTSARPATAMALRGSSAPTLWWSWPRWPRLPSLRVSNQSSMTSGTSRSHSSRTTMCTIGRPVSTSAGTPSTCWLCRRTPPMVPSRRRFCPNLPRPTTNSTFQASVALFPTRCLTKPPRITDLASIKRTSKMTRKSWNSWPSRLSWRWTSARWKRSVSTVRRRLCAALNPWCSKIWPMAVLLCVKQLYRPKTLGLIKWAVWAHSKM